MEAIAELIANQLKEMYNMAYVFIEEKQYDRARECYENILVLCSVAQYEEGKKMAYISLCNLYMLMNNPIAALENAISAGAKDMISKLIAPAMQVGMQFERERKIEDAIFVYELVVPYLKENKRSVVMKEIKMLKESIHECKVNSGKLKATE